jgi:hypothetical protein
MQRGRQCGRVRARPAPVVPVRPAPVPSAGTFGIRRLGASVDNRARTGHVEAVRGLSRRANQRGRTQAGGCLS